MNIAALLLAAAGVACATWVVLASRSEQARRAAERTSDRTWDQAIANADGVERVLIKGGRHFAGIGDAVDSSGAVGRFIEAKLLAAGGRYGSNKDIFFAVQAVTVIIGAAIVAFAGLGLFPMFLGLAGPIIAGLPYMELSSTAQKRAAQINAGLPEFADLLSMPLSVGRPVIPALTITAERTEGPVSEEVTNMLALIHSHALTETEAFRLAGERLGTPEAKAFFNVLSQGQTEGAKVIENLESQAEALRTAWYQERRAHIKKLPPRMIVVFGIHFIPVLLLFAIFPVAIAIMEL